MLLWSSNSPRGSSTNAPLAITCAASGTSAVTTRSPACASCAMRASATSKPDGTCSARIQGEGGTRSIWLAIKVSRISARLAAR